MDIKFTIKGIFNQNELEYLSQITKKDLFLDQNRETLLYNDYPKEENFKYEFKIIQSVNRSRNIDKFKVVISKKPIK